MLNTILLWSGIFFGIFLLLAAFLIGYGVRKIIKEDSRRRKPVVDRNRKTSACTSFRRAGLPVLRIGRQAYDADATDLRR
jgi:hypothetical protein